MVKGKLFFCVALIVTCVFAADASAQDKPSILFVAAESGEGRLSQIVDSVYKEKLKAEGYTIASCFVRQLTAEALAKFNLMVLVRQAIPGNPADDYDLFLDKRGMIFDYVKAGGGLMVMSSEEYGIEAGSLNEFMDGLDITFHFNTIIDTDGNRNATMPIDPTTSMVLIDLLAHPITEGMSTLWVPNLGGHGAQTLSLDVSSPEWQVIGRGSRTSHSTPAKPDVFPKMKSFDENPPFIAVRTLGKGRIVVFASGAPFWVINGYHRRWSNGWLFNQGNGQGFQFFLNCYQWLGEVSLGSGVFGGYTADMAEALFPPIAASATSDFFIVPPDEHDLSGNAYRCLIGARTTLTGGESSLEEYAEAAKAAGYDCLVLLEDYRKLDKDNWTQLEKHCAEASDEAFLVVPGFELIDDEGNREVAYNLTRFPDILTAYTVPNILRAGLLREGKSTTVYATPKHNKDHPWNFGSFNALEVFSYDHGELAEEALDWYRALEQADYKLIPVAIYRMTSAEEIQDVKGYDSYVIAKTLEDVPANVQLTRHNAFVSSGPRLTTFYLTGEGMTDDRFEGLWYEWMPGDVATLHIRAESDVPIATVELISSQKVLYSFHPMTKTFEKEIPLVLTQDLNVFAHVVDADGGEAVSASCDTRCRVFWGHLGLDRMNTYTQIWKESPDASTIIRDKRMEAFGAIYVASGWGDYVRLIASIPASDIAPRGIEVGAAEGGLDNVNVIPMVRSTAGDEIAVSRQRRGFAFRSRDCQIFTATCDAKRVAGDVDAPVVTIEGKTIEPAHYKVVPTELFDFSARYYIYRWRTYSPISIVCDTTITAKKDFTLKDIDGVEIAFLEPRLKTGQWLRYYTYTDPEKGFQDVKADFAKGTAVATDVALAKRGFAALWPDAYGSVAVYALDDNDYSFDVGGSSFGINLKVGLNAPSRLIKKGETLHARLLLVHTAGNESDSSPFVNFYDDFGFDGTPAYTVSAVRGTVTDTTYALSVDAAGGGAVLDISAADLPVDLPLAISRVNGNQPAGVVDLAEGAIDLGGVYKDTLLMCVDISAGAHLYAGNLIMSDSLDVRIQYSPEDASVYVNNPTEEAVTCRIYSPEELRMLLPVDKTVRLEAGEITVIMLK